MLNEADYGQTDLAMNRGSNAGDETLVVKFYTFARHSLPKSKEAGRPIYEDVPYIKIMSPGNRDSVVERPAREADKHRFPQHWRNFQARENQEVVEGTPLSEWPAIQVSQVEELKFMHVLTLEQLVAMSDVNAQNIRGVYALKEKAQKYLDNAKEGLASEALAEQRDINAELLERLKALEDNAPEKPSSKRGRPKKAEAPLKE
tara:strand:- start:2691 stop:3299 length:609 start_codon:yes stop_codon:yes gene_type:complete